MSRNYNAYGGQQYNSSGNSRLHHSQSRDYGHVSESEAGRDFYDYETINYYGANSSFPAENGGRNPSATSYNPMPPSNTFDTNPSHAASTGSFDGPSTALIQNPVQDPEGALHTVGHGENLHSVIQAGHSPSSLIIHILKFDEAMLHDIRKHPVHFAYCSKVKDHYDSMNKTAPSKKEWGLMIDAFGQTMEVYRSVHHQKTTWHLWGKFSLQYLRDRV